MPSAATMMAALEPSTVELRHFVGLDVRVEAVLSPKGVSARDAKQLVAFGLAKNETVADLSSVCGGALVQLKDAGDFEAGVGEISWSYLFGNEATKQIALVGLGQSPVMPGRAASRIGAGLAALILGKRLESVTFALKGSRINEEGITTLVSSLLFNLMPDTRYQSKPRKSSLCLLRDLRVILLGTSTLSQEAMTKAVAEAKVLAQGNQISRQLANAPPNVAHPINVAAAAEQLARDYGLKCQILDENDCSKLKMGAFLGVGKGSVNKPRFLHMTYSPELKSADTKRLVLIGKGVTMDTGGYNVKLVWVETMKADMSGAAAVIGAAAAVAQLKPANVEVHFITALAENMISSTAYRPGDVLTASDGKTIEIGNTDAEGRLTLCDALVYAQTQLGGKPDLIVDCATLTGAGKIGLGPHVAALYGKRDETAAKMLQSASTTGELMWRMPLVEEYKAFNKSNTADLNNIPSTKQVGGSITAALFLSEFVHEDVDWLHIDFAGPSWDGKEGVATGWGARTLANFALSL